MYLVQNVQLAFLEAMPFLSRTFHVNPRRWQESSTDATFDWVTTENESTASEQDQLRQSLLQSARDFCTVKGARQTLYYTKKGQRSMRTSKHYSQTKSPNLSKKQNTKSNTLCQIERQI